ncbi:IS110 family transposase [Glycomyces paridis]|uniref:IS110 family transposase n=1 Tax=Glycomyces paridis TaxID=2126555 RepID=A0A4S8P776_9ACTN|nr:IS110 family transposase [Glycomyces paridis]THV23569.1 IS110 family transposase [Glycomyces paridis]
MSTIPQTPPIIEITGGVDTHRDTHTAAAIDTSGRLLGAKQFKATTTGYRKLLTWLTSFGSLALVGVEGTGVYGAGLTRHLQAEAIKVVEIDRPDRKMRRWQGKSDPVDAEAAARAAQAGHRTGTPKQRTGAVEALRALRVARRSAVRQRTDTLRQMKALIISAPEPLRASLRTSSNPDLVTTCAAFRPDPARLVEPATATRAALRALARRVRNLDTEITDLDTDLAPLVASINPDLLALNGVGTEVAGQLLVTAGQNTNRIRNEAAFAMLCGIAPLPASSGQTHRHRLNRGGDRQANAAIHRIAITRLRWDPRTRAYMEKRTKEGLSKKDIIRCLKRYIAREIFTVLSKTTTPTENLQSTT